MANRKSPLHADPVPPEPPDGPEPLGVPERGGEYFDAVLEDTDLDGADLAHSRFVRCELRRVRLTAAVLRGATLIDVTLDDCELSGAGLHEATLTRVAIRAGRAIGADLSATSLGHVRITDVRLDDVNLRLAELEHVVVEDSSLVEGDCAEAKLRAVTFQRCDLTALDLGKVGVEGRLDLRGSRIDGMKGVAALRNVRIGVDQVVPYAVRVFAETKVEIAE
jgi:uncharacterized protein YjbI with pentapeptide repeats